MSDYRQVFAGVVADILGDHCTAERLGEFEGGLDRALWNKLGSSGLTRLGVAEEDGGSGGSFGEIAVLLRLIGEHSAQVPIAEGLLAARLLAASRQPLPDGILTVGVGDVAATRSARGWRIEGVLRRVAYGHCADAVVGIARSPEGPLVFMVAPGDTTIVRGANLAREPRDHMAIDVDLAEAVNAATELPAELAVRGQVTRALMIDGAAGKALDLMVQYANQREQFGRRISAFQAVQQQVALAAAEVTASRAAVDAAVAALDRDIARASFAADAAKVRAGQAAGLTAAIAHQIHGAIGITHEHSLRLTTTRLWAWREEWGTDVQAARQVAAAAVTAGEQDLWPLLVGA
jgi:acyl-CoA dehydrogenase